MSNQRQLISEAKERVREIREEITNLTYEMRCVMDIIEREELFIKTFESNLTKSWKKKLKHGQRNKEDKLKAALGGIRDGN